MCLSTCMYVSTYVPSACAMGRSRITCRSLPPGGSRDQTQVHVSGSTASVLTNCAITPIPKHTWIEPGIMVPAWNFSIQGIESKRIMSLKLAS